jgi:transcriptional/translational regulatory protein YebC/TACO1
MSAAIDAGADDFQEDGDNWEVISPPESHDQVLEAVKAAGADPVAAQVAMLPQNLVKVEGKSAQQLLRLMHLLEDQDDVQHVWANFDIDAKEIEASLA